MQRGLVWFRNDLRIKDNETLLTAVEECDEVIAFYCLDDHYFRELPFGFPKTGSFRAQFILESLFELDQQLKELGGALVVMNGCTADEIQKLHTQFPLQKIYYSRELTREEKEIEKSVEALGIPTATFLTQMLYRPEDVPIDIRDVPEVFTDFRKRVEKGGQIREEFSAPDKIHIPEGLEIPEHPTLEDLNLEPAKPDQRGVLDFEGGEDRAWERLQHYFWEADRLKKYKFTRNGLVGADYSSKFSAWLAQGCISPVSIYNEVQRYEAEVKKNVSTYWLVFELLWRDFFKFVALKKGDHFFKMERDWTPTAHRDFDKWRMGETDDDFVNANMLELLYTGYMSNRGRQNVASYLVKDLGQPWYAGAAWFESQLIDYDVCSNYGNWTYVAGVGNDPRKNRYFNVKSQAERYDPKAEYRELWLES